MATGLSTGAATTLMTTLTGAYTWVQLHTADPGANGTNLVATENTRVQVTWEGTGVTRTNNGALVWADVAGTEDYTHFSVWSASTSGNFGLSGTVTSNSVTTGDTFTIPDGDLSAQLPVAS